MSFANAHFGTREEPLPRSKFSTNSATATFSPSQQFFRPRRSRDFFPNSARVRRVRAEINRTQQPDPWRVCRAVKISIIPFRRARKKLMERNGEIPFISTPRHSAPYSRLHILFTYLRAPRVLLAGEISTIRSRGRKHFPGKKIRQLNSAEVRR